MDTALRRCGASPPSDIVPTPSQGRNDELGAVRACATGARVMRPAAFVVEDDDAYREALTQLLEDAGLRVEAFASGEAFLCTWKPEDRSCLLLDIELPGPSGLELQSMLAQRAGCIPIVFLTGYGDVAQLLGALKAGAFGFLEKPVPRLLLLDRVRSAIAEDSKTHAARTVADQARSRAERLTAREREILRHVDSGRSGMEIARRLGISPRTVEAHRAHIMEKTGSRNAVDLIRIERALRGPEAQGQPLGWDPSRSGPGWREQ